MSSSKINAYGESRTSKEAHQQIITDLQEQMAVCKQSIHLVLSEELKHPKPSLVVHAYNLCNINAGFTIFK